MSKEQDPAQIHRTHAIGTLTFIYPVLPSTCILSLVISFDWTFILYFLEEQKMQPFTASCVQVMLETDISHEVATFDLCLLLPILLLHLMYIFSCSYGGL